ncbi:hypothetical protein GCM10009575_000060 [Streptomyces rhizosphaericus]|uniref:ABC transporter ATP-binding protein n=1 Tax=Streptomyces rhizosphaericus TaxID=114699 RepID=A0ABN1NR99_9ACTN
MIEAREMTKRYGDPGRSARSHLMALAHTHGITRRRVDEEMALIADHLIVVGRGRLLADTTLDDFTRTADGVGMIAAAHGVPLYELTPQSASLETAFMDLTRDAVEYHSAPADHADTDRKAA